MDVGLTPLCVPPVFRYFSLNTRKCVSALCPSMNGLHGKLPLRLDSLEVSPSGLRFDKDCWFLRSYGELIDEELIKKYIDYYVNRPGTVINKISIISNIPFHSWFTDCGPFLVKCLSIESDSFSDEIAPFLSWFAQKNPISNAKLNELEIFTDNIPVAVLKKWTNFKKLDILMRPSHGSAHPLDLIVGQIETLAQNGALEELSFTTKFERTENENWKQGVRQLKESLGLEYGFYQTRYGPSSVLHKKLANGRTFILKCDLVRDNVDYDTHQRKMQYFISVWIEQTEILPVCELSAKMHVFRVLFVWTFVTVDCVYNWLFHIRLHRKVQKRIEQCLDYHFCLLPFIFSSPLLLGANLFSLAAFLLFNFIITGSSIYVFWKVLHDDDLDEVCRCDMAYMIQ